MEEGQDEEEVTVPAGFVLDLVEECRHLGPVAKPLLKMTAHLKADVAPERCSHDLFNDACDWIERELGMTSVRMAGRQIGHRVYAAMRERGASDRPSTLDMMRALETTSRSLIHDPEGHGWDLVRHDPNVALLRNTQGTNCILSEGVLQALMEHAGASEVQLRQVCCTRRGDESCDFEVRWR